MIIDVVTLTENVAVASTQLEENLVEVQNGFGT